MPEKVVNFRNQEGKLLFGILHAPDKLLNSRVGINILNPGLKSRVAPNRINVKMARMFCEMGFYVLRFDPAGIGDSEGELPAHDSIMNLWGMVQRGLFVSDTVVANEWFIRDCQLDKLIMIGQCGGAVTSMLVAGGDYRVESLILVDCSVRLLSSEADLSDIMLETHRPSELAMYYLGKVFDWKAWRNLLRCKSDFRGVGIFLGNATNAIARKCRPKVQLQAEVSARFNKLLWEAFCSFMRRKKKVCFIFAEKDFSLKEFQQDMEMGLLPRSPLYSPQYACHIIKDANHVYTEEKWQHDLLQRMRSWLNQYQPAC